TGGGGGDTCGGTTGGGADTCAGATGGAAWADRAGVVVGAVASGSTSLRSPATYSGLGIRESLTSSYWPPVSRKNSFPASSNGMMGLFMVSARANSRSTHTEFSADGVITATTTAHVSI